MAAKNINAAQLKDLIASKHTVLVDFWAPWCPHCRKINPAYEQIATEYAASLDVVKVDVENNLIAVRGAVPGPRGGVVMLSDSVKKA